MRLDKFLCDCGIGTRSQVKNIVKRGSITVNGQPQTKADYKLNEQQDIVSYNGKILKYSPFVYYLFHKPAGVVSATQDNTCKTVIQSFGEAYQQKNNEEAPFLKELFPVGRLDKDTEGLLLLTNDGELTHQLLSPRRHIDKTYYVQLQKELSAEDCNRLEAGITLEDFTTKPAKVECLSPLEINLTITEGKFHQVKRMLQAVDNQVLYLKRIAMGTLYLEDSLCKGDYRELTDSEIEALQSQSN